jgi:hypothetical protein
MAQMKPLAWLIGALIALPTAVLAQAQQAQPLDAQARASMGAGNAAGAVHLMREYVAEHPQDQAAALDLARYLTWNGDYAGAKRVLDANPQATQSAEGQVVLAALLAWAGRLDAALQANAPILLADPQGLLPNYTQATALRKSAQPRAALPYVEAVNRAKPGSRDAADLARATRIATDSFVLVDVQHGSDSDDLSHSMPSLRGELAHGNALRYTVELGRWDHRSPVDSPFASIDGRDSIAESRGLFGLRYAPSLHTEWSAAVGHSSAGNDGVALWRLGLDHRASDSWRLWLAADHDRLEASPRSVSLGLERTMVSGHAQWTPDFAWTGDLWLRRDHYSDGNSSAEENVAMRRAVVRQPHVMLDVGVAVQHLGYDHNPGNGYYAPDNYRRYALTASSYFGITDDVGLSVQAGLGRQRDETFTAWRRANDLAVAMVFGIYSPWQLTLSGAYSERVLSTGAYEGRSWGVTLMRRF